MHESPDPSKSASANCNPAELLEAVYDQLRAIAQQRMREENAGHTLQATALVHEAYLRVVRNRRVPFRDQAQFFGAAAEAMRRILIDHARAKGAAKRKRPRSRDPISVVDLAEEQDLEQILALDEALARLDAQEPDVAAVLRLRFFAGLTGEDTAAALGVSPRHVDQVWAYARAWMAREMRTTD